MYQSEESAFGPIHTAVIRALGGTDVHLGLITAVMGSAGALVHWVGAWLLRRFGSNRKAMYAALSLGVSFGLLLVLTLLGAFFFTAGRIVFLSLYILFVFGLAGASGVQNNVETNWIGDLVPLHLRGWFTSVKWVISALGVLLLILLFGQAAGRWPGLGTYSGLFLIIALSHVAAILLMSTVTDRNPETVSFFAKRGDTDRIDYRSRALWSYIGFWIFWVGGRMAHVTFLTAYLLDHLNYSMDKIVMVFGLTNLINIVMLLVMGRVSDRIGTGRPLIFVSGGVGFCMLLWVASAWWGIWPIIAYQLINGAAGTTHSMLSTNYGLEILPAKGRAAYFALVRMAIGITAMLSATLAGVTMNALRGWRITLWGSEFNHYHLFFTGCALVTVLCVLPLIWLRKTPTERHS
jgi:MFS family permease